jgi:phosphohistidine phosphatase
MLLLLCRHAQAAEHDPHQYPDDTLRPLVGKGRRAQRRVARELRRRDLVPSTILSSPWLRAWDTGAIMRDELGLKKRAQVVCESLATSPDLGAIGHDVGAKTSHEIVALVGHEPWIGELAALLLTGKATGVAIEVAKSGVLGIEIAEIEAGRGTLKFLW